MTRRMTGRVDPSPARHPGNVMIRRQRDEALPEIDAFVRSRRPVPAEDAATHRGIGWWIVGGPCQERELGRVGVYGDVPDRQQRLQRPDMVEVTVRQDDGRRPRV